MISDIVSQMRLRPQINEQAIFLFSPGGPCSWLALKATTFQLPSWRRLKPTPLDQGPAPADSTCGNSPNRERSELGVQRGGAAKAWLVSRSMRVIRYAAYTYQEFGLGRGKVVGLTKSPNASSELPHHVVRAIGIVAPSSEFYHRVTVLLDVQNGLCSQVFYWGGY